MTVVTDPHPTDTDERSLDERVAELEALIEEARQRARRRRRRNGAVAVALVLAAGAALYAGGDGVRVESARSADGDATPTATLDRRGSWSVPTGPPGFSAGVVLHPTRPGALYLYAGGRVYRSTDSGRSWKSGPPIALKLDALTVDPRRGSILYAGTNDGVLKSADAAAPGAGRGSDRRQAEAAGTPTGRGGCTRSRSTRPTAGTCTRSRGGSGSPSPSAHVTPARRGKPCGWALRGT